MAGTKQLLEDRVASATGKLFMITLLVRCMGYLEKVLLAYFFGTSNAIDVYQTVFTLVTVLFFFTREIIEAGYINLFLRTMEKDEQKAWSLFNFFFRAILVIHVFIVLAGVCYPGRLVHLIAPGFTGEKARMATGLVRIAFWGVLFYSLSAITTITLNATKKFTFSAAGELVFKIVFIAALLLGGRTHSVIVLGWGLLSASVVKLGLHLVKLAGHLRFSNTGIGREDRRGMLTFLIPLFWSVCFSQLSLLFNNYQGSYLGEGAISSIGYAKKLVEFLVTTIAYTLSVILFPYLTDLLARGERGRAVALFRKAFRWILLCFLPLTLFLWIYGREIVELVYLRGAFTRVSAEKTFIPFSIFIAGMPVMALECVIIVFYYACGDFRRPAYTGIVCSVIDMALVYVFIRWWGYAGIALGFVLSRYLKVTALVLYLYYKGDLRLSGDFLYKGGLCLGLFTIVLFVVKDSFIQYYFRSVFMGIGMVFLVSGFFYLACIRLVRLHRLMPD